MNFQSWLHIATKELARSESRYRDAEILLRYVTGRERSWILAFGETVLTDSETQQLVTLLARRKNGEPIAYLTEEREFWSLSLSMSPVAFIPRPDTECLVEQVINHLPLSSCRILDLGTGTGAIALALAFERPDCQVIAVDIMSDVVHLAKHNIKRLGIKNVQIIQSSWFSALNGEVFDVIVSNPPYIDEKDQHLLLGDVRFEPRTSLVAAENGLADIRHIVAAARQHLSVVGWLLIEHGFTQGAVVRSMFIEAGFHNVKTYRDYGGNDRLTLGRSV